MKGGIKASAKVIKHTFFVGNRRLARNIMEFMVRLCWIFVYLFFIGNFQQFTQASQMWLLTAIRFCAVVAFSSGLFVVLVDVLDGTRYGRLGLRFINRIFILLLMLLLILGVNNMKVWLEGVTG